MKIHTDKVFFSPPERWMKIRTIDMHTGGEPLRIFMDGLPPVKGRTILEKRRYFREHLDHIRTGMMWEPRGHADMYGAVLTDPVSEDADFGTFFMHNDGYSTMCGHAIIALTKMALDCKLVDRKGSKPHLIIDAPPGRIIANATRVRGRVRDVSFLNVPSFVQDMDMVVQVPGLGRVKYDIAYGGAFYAIVDAHELGLELEQTEYDKMIDYGRRIKQAVIRNQKIVHPAEDELSFLYGTIFTGNAFDVVNHSRNVCVFADGEVDRSATGSGVSARAALHYARGELKMGEKITIESILGTTMDVEIVEETIYGPYKAVIPEVKGFANFTGSCEFWFDPGDPLKKGFIFR
jgi:trans-L-3-hydroxyproline dehydratase